MAPSPNCYSKPGRSNQILVNTFYYEFPLAAFRAVISKEQASRGVFYLVRWTEGKRSGFELQQPKHDYEEISSETPPMLVVLCCSKGLLLRQLKRETTNFVNGVLLGIYCCIEEEWFCYCFIEAVLSVLFVTHKEFYNEEDLTI